MTRTRITVSPAEAVMRAGLGRSRCRLPDFCAGKVDELFLGAVRVEGYLAPSWPSSERSQQMHVDLAVGDCLRA